MVEMASNECHVSITRLSNGFPVVKGFDDGEESMVLLDVASNRVQVLRPLMTGQGGPGLVRFLRSCDRCVHIGFRSIRRVHQMLLVRWADGGAKLSSTSLHPLIVDEETEFSLVRVEPRSSTIVGFGTTQYNKGNKKTKCESYSLSLSLSLSLGERTLGRR